MLPARSAPLAFGSPSLPLPSSNARHRCTPLPPQLATLAPWHPLPPLAPLWSLQTSQLESHELNEYCTTPFRNGAFQGEIRYTGAPSRVTYGTLAYLIRSPYHFIQGKICVIPTALTISYDLANLLISLLLDAFESFSEDSI